MAMPVKAFSIAQELGRVARTITTSLSDDAAKVVVADKPVKFGFRQLGIFKAPRFGAETTRTIEANAGSGLFKAIKQLHGAVGTTNAGITAPVSAVVGSSEEAAKLAARHGRGSSDSLIGMLLHREGRSGAKFATSPNLFVSGGGTKAQAPGLDDVEAAARGVVAALD